MAASCHQCSLTVHQELGLAGALFLYALQGEAVGLQAASLCESASCFPELVTNLAADNMHIGECILVCMHAEAQNHLSHVYSRFPYPLTIATQD